MSDNPFQFDNMVWGWGINPDEILTSAWDGLGQLEIVKVHRDKRGWWSLYSTGKRSESVKAFVSHKPERHTFSVMEDAGFAELLEGMEEDAALHFSEMPFLVTVTQNGQYLELIGCEKRNGHEPDKDIEVDVLTTRDEAKRHAQYMLRHTNLILDFETTGLHDRREPIQVAVIKTFPNDHYAELLNTYIRPTHPERVKPGVHTITKEMLMGAPTFQEIYSELALILWEEQWMGYFVNFDAETLAKATYRWKLPFIPNSGLLDVSGTIARYLGDFSQNYLEFKTPKLTEACRRLRVEVVDEHDALGDCVLTFKCLRAIAAGVEPLPAEETS